MPLTCRLLRIARAYLGVFALLAVLWPLHAPAQQPLHSQCTALGGNDQCIISDASFMVQRGPNLGQTFPSGDEACISAAASQYGTQYRNARFYGLHPQYGTGCEYDVYYWAGNGYNQYAGRFLFANWVLANQICPPLPNPAAAYEDRADTSVSSKGRTWCSYRSPDSDSSCPAFNPTTPGLGDKLHSEIDYTGAGAHALEFTRHYRSRWNVGATGALAPLITTRSGWEQNAGWLHSYHRAIQIDARYPRLRAVVTRGDGTATVFFADRVASGPRTWLNLQGSRDALIDQFDSASGVFTGWIYKASADDSEDSFDAAGKLVRSRARNGWLTTLTYSSAATPPNVAPRAGLLLSVANHFGRELRLTYDAAGRIRELLPPGAVSGSAAGSTTSPIRYAYDESPSLGAGVGAQGQLTSVTWQDGAVRRYHYEDNRFPGALTGITDEAGVRYATYTYDASGRVLRSEHAGGVDRADFSYGGTPTSPTTTLTDYSGAGGGATSRTYTFTHIAGVRRPVSVSAPCSQCGGTQASTSYDAGGNITRTVGHDGVVTFYAYDAQGREVEQASFASSYQGATTRPPLSAATSVTSTQWHATWKLPLQVAEPGKLTAYSYDSNGNLTGQSWTATTDATGAQGFAATATGSTFATGLGYDASSLATTVVETVNGIEAGRWFLAYNALGNVMQVTDVTAGNLVGEATQYDTHGRLLAGTNTLGLPVVYGYSPRGFVSTRSISGQTTTFTQNTIGLTSDVLLPDGQTVRFEYDATHRLAGVRLNGSILTAMAAKNGSRSIAVLAIARERLQRLIESIVRPAYAQPAIPAGLMPPGSVAPGMVLPGQPGVGATAILTANDYPGERPGGIGLPLFGAREAAIRRLAEALARFCQCDPNGGFDRPRLTPQGNIHIVMSGHTGPGFANKSYFTEPVNQALVDEVVSKATERDLATGRYYVADIGRDIGYARKKVNGVLTFVPSREVTLWVEPEHCNGTLRNRNEVLTMYPGK